MITSSTFSPAVTESLSVLPWLWSEAVKSRTASVRDLAAERAVPFMRNHSKAAVPGRKRQLSPLEVLK